MITAWIGSVLFSAILLLYVAVTFGAPLGEFVLGGKYKKLPAKLRTLSFFSVLVQAFSILILLVLGRIIAFPLPISLAKGFGFFFSAYFLLNTLLNLKSESRKEKYVMTPVSIIIGICFLITTITS